VGRQRSGLQNAAAAPLSASRKHQRMLLLSVMNMLHQAIGQWMAQTATEK
jgi:hypothetical protein